MTLTTRLHSLLMSATDSGDIPGVVAIIADDRGLIFEGASGLRALDQPEAFTPDTVAWCASMTKAVTATAAMQLVEQGRLQLDCPAAEVCPELDELQVLDGFDADGKPLLRAPKHRVTLRQLMTHTSGLAYEFGSKNLLRWIGLNQAPGVISGSRELLLRPLVCDPGTRWEYGTGIDWTGLMVERVSGQRLGAYLQEHIFAPLKMYDIGFTISEAGRGKLAGVHVRAADGNLTRIPFALPDVQDLDMGGHGLYGPMTAYIRFLQMILGGGELEGARVLKPETVTTMGRNHCGAISVQPIKSAMPELWSDAEFFPGAEHKYGLSFLINEGPLSTGRAAGSMAWAGLANSYYWIDPVCRRTGVVLAQILPFLDPKMLALVGAIEAAVYSEA